MHGVNYKRKSDFYKNYLLEKFYLNPNLFDRLLSELQKKKYFNEDPIKKIQYIAELVKNKKYKKIAKLAKKIYGEELISSLKVEELYNKKSKHTENYYYNRLTILNTFKKIIPSIELLSIKGKKSGKGKKSKKRRKLGGKSSEEDTPSIQEDKPSNKTQKAKNSAYLERIKKKIKFI